MSKGPTDNLIPPRPRLAELIAKLDKAERNEAELRKKIESVIRYELPRAEEAEYRHNGRFTPDARYIDFQQIEALNWVTDCRQTVADAQSAMAAAADQTAGVEGDIARRINEMLYPILSPVFAALASRISDLERRLAKARG